MLSPALRGGDNALVSAPEQVGVVTPAPSRRGRVPVWLDRSARVLLLVCLLAGTVGSVLPRFASPAGVDQLTADLDAGRVRAASVESGGTVRWTSDWWQWRRAPAPESGQGAETWLRARAGDSVQVEGRGSSARAVLAEPAWLPLRAAMLAAGVAALVLMFARRRRWLADRSGWFWMFAGGVGAPFYLLLEPEPLWSRPGRLPRLARWRRLPFGPVAGFLLGWVGISAVFIVIDLVGLLS